MPLYMGSGTLLCRSGAVRALAGCCLFACACGAAAHGGALPENALRAPAPRLVGRFDTSGQTARFAWSASSIEVRFSGTGLWIRLRVPASPDRQQPGADAAMTYAVTIDGGPARWITVVPTTERYEIASGLDPRAIHVASVTREAEAFGGVHELLGFEVPTGGELLPPKPKKHGIEIVGDSISCGYGVLGKDASCSFSFATERASLAYGTLAGRALDADVTTLCWSGRGVYRNFDKGDEPRMPELYERTIPTEDAGFPFDKEEAPDAVIVNLGTNDFFADHDHDKKPDPIDAAAFEARYIAFLARVREVRPRAAIFVTTSPMLSGAIGAKAKASLAKIVSARREDGDGRVELLELEEQGTRLGCDAHPNAEMHRVLAAQVEAALRPKLEGGDRPQPALPK